jgi:hypothetical protein
VAFAAAKPPMGGQMPTGMLLCAESPGNEPDWGSR